MPMNPQTVFPRALSHTWGCIGDSLTFNFTMCQHSGQAWPEVCAVLLRQMGAHVKFRNYGISGDTTRRMLARAWCMNQRETPDGVTIWGGTNDAIGATGISSITSVGTVATITSLIEGHGFLGGELITVTGAAPAAYNVTNAAVTVVSPTVFTYPMGSAPGAQTNPISGITAASPISLAQTQANLQAIIKCAKFGARWAVAGQANLPAVTTQGMRLVVMTDTSVNGGEPAGPGQTATVTGAGGSTQTVWESRFNAAGEKGWGRVTNTAGTTTPDHVTRIIVLGQHYLNWSSGGDTVSTPYAPWDNITGLRVYQNAAVVAEQVTGATIIYADQHAFFQARIVLGPPTGDTQGDHLWHAADTPNVHFSAYGNGLAGQFHASTITAQTGWLAALST